MTSFFMASWVAGSVSLSRVRAKRARAAATSASRVATSVGSLSAIGAAPCGWRGGHPRALRRRRSVGGDVRRIFGRGGGAARRPGPGSPRGVLATYAGVAALGRGLEEARQPEARDERASQHRRGAGLGEAPGLVHQLIDAAVLQRRREAVDAGGDTADIAAGRGQRPLDLGGDAVGEFRRRVDLLGRLALLVLGKRARLLLGARGEARSR